MLKTLIGYLTPSPLRHVSRARRVEFDAQICDVQHRYGRDELLLLKDQSGRGTSITNGIEEVLAHVVHEGHLKPGMLVLYCDSMKIWDQVLIDDQCRFVGFRSIHEDSEDSAISRVLRMEYAHER